MKTLFTRNVRGFPLTFLLSLAGAFPLGASTPGITYQVDWPAIHLAGTFTLDVGSGFGTYSSASASGTYGGLSGTFNTVWTQVQFNSQANYSELDFNWDQVFTVYAVSSSYVGLSSSWTSADEAWRDLIAKGASDGVYISVVPEPAVVGLFFVGLPMLVVLRHRSRFLTPLQKHESRIKTLAAMRCSERRHRITVAIAAPCGRRR